jgi:hypothetical protein
LTKYETMKGTNGIEAQKVGQSQKKHKHNNRSLNRINRIYEINK